MNHNFHSGDQDPLHRFLNALEPDSYIRPHRHLTPKKDELFLILQGRGGVVIYDEAGTAVEFYLLDAAQGCFGMDIGAGLFHSIFALEPGTIFYEVKVGPYIPLTEKDFATWAPLENSPEAKGYLERQKALWQKAIQG